MRAILVVAAAAGALGAFVPTSATAAAQLDTVTLVSESGDYIGGGELRTFDSRTGPIFVRDQRGAVEVVAGGDPATAAEMRLDFTGPGGQALVPGLYRDARRWPFSGPLPGLSVAGDGRGCNQLEGEFEIKDIGRRPDGTVERLWALYEQHCEGGKPALFGEVRIGLPTPAVLAVPSAVRWPALDVGAAGRVLPVSLVAHEAAVRDIRVALEGTEDFAGRADECSGRSLPVGGRCDVWLRFAPRTPGAKAASLRLAHAEER